MMILMSDDDVDGDKEDLDDVSAPSHAFADSWEQATFLFKNKKNININQDNLVLSKK